MKKVFLALSIGIGLVACGDNTGSSTETNPGGSIDSNVTAPVPDNTTVQPDTTPSDTGTIKNLNDGTNRDGTSSGEAGSSTSAPNSGSAKDDNKGTN